MTSLRGIARRTNVWEPGSRSGVQDDALPFPRVDNGNALVNPRRDSERVFDEIVPRVDAA